MSLLFRLNGARAGTQLWYRVRTKRLSRCGPGLRASARGGFSPPRKEGEPDDDGCHGTEPVVPRGLLAFVLHPTTGVTTPVAVRKSPCMGACVLACWLVGLGWSHYVER